MLIAPPLEGRLPVTRTDYPVCSCTFSRVWSNLTYTFRDLRHEIDPQSNGATAMVPLPCNWECSTGARPSACNCSLFPCGTAPIIWLRFMASKLMVKRSSLKVLMDHRRPDLRIIDESNRQPDGQHIPVSQRQSIITVGQTHCRWPIGDPQNGGFFLCGAKTGTTESYCHHHMQVAYRN